ncbi:GDYXXLXY domain-containing protein [Nocardioides limicola]|uniref:GDYXXLXY domain-containing protein n=1 Tax=Nocardioides limicola TaxID=2803368 RepID=UPI00193C5D6F|nr:GDYXXLXY domain-containing protein [Nocardioides sp. DJM-14]
MSTTVIAGRRLVVLAVVLFVQFALVGVAVQDRLSARVLGDEYLLRVEPVDPWDPFRGAYVDLGYPDLSSDQGASRVPGDRGAVFIPLTAQGSVLVGGPGTRTRPSEGLYLRCDDRDWRLRCGIESLFLPPDKALATERAVWESDQVARIKLDSRGNAALLGVEPAP